MANGIYDVPSFYPGSVQDSDLIFAFEAPRDVKFTGGLGYVQFPPDAAVTFQVERDGSDVGDVDIDTSGTFVFTFTGGEIVLNDGQRLEIISPASGNDGMGNVSITLLGEENPDADDPVTVYDFAGYFPETLPPGVRIMQWVVGQNGVVLNSGGGVVEVGSTLPVTLTIKTLVGSTLSQIGTILVDGTSVTVAVTSTSLGQGNLIIVETPQGSNPVDATLEGLAITFVATRTPI